jgi:hypothetical protein
MSIPEKVRRRLRFDVEAAAGFTMLAPLGQY